MTHFTSLLAYRSASQDISGEIIVEIILVGHVDSCFMKFINQLEVINIWAICETKSGKMHSVRLDINHLNDPMKASIEGNAKIIRYHQGGLASRQNNMISLFIS